MIILIMVAIITLHSPNDNDHITERTVLIVKTTGTFS